MKKNKIFISICAVFFAIVVIYTTNRTSKLNKMASYLPTLEELKTTFDIERDYFIKEENIDERGYCVHASYHNEYRIETENETHDSFMESLHLLLLIDGVSPKNRMYTHYVESNQETISSLKTDDEKLQLYHHSKDTYHELFGIYTTEDYQLYILGDVNDPDYQWHESDTICDVLQLIDLIESKKNKS